MTEENLKKIGQKQYKTKNTQKNPAFFSTLTSIIGFGK